jgi:hypothetical protein
MLRILAIAVVLAACGGSGNEKLDAPSSGDASNADAPGGGDGSVGVDAAIAPGPACLATTCMLGQEECCLGAQTVCKPTGTCPTQPFACDGPEDCAGAVCCFVNNNGSRCQTNNCGAIACHVDADCPAGAPKCCPKPFTPNYRGCQAQC